MMNFIKNTVRPAIYVATGMGYFVGITSGCFCGNRSVSIKYKGIKTNNINLRHTLPIISGLTGAVLFPLLLICSPIIVVDYYGNLCMFDKLIDNFNSKYSIDYKRYHQYGLNDDKYYAPSLLQITIIKK